MIPVLILDTVQLYDTVQLAQLLVRECRILGYFVNNLIINYKLPVNKTKKIFIFLILM